jgi:hypothetical protein
MHRRLERSHESTPRQAASFVMLLLGPASENLKQAAFTHGYLEGAQLSGAKLVHTLHVSSSRILSYTYDHSHTRKPAYTCWRQAWPAQGGALLPLAMRLGRGAWCMEVSPLHVAGAGMPCWSPSGGAWPQGRQPLSGFPLPRRNVHACCAHFQYIRWCAWCRALRSLRTVRPTTPPERMRCCTCISQEGALHCDCDCVHGIDSSLRKQGERACLCRTRCDLMRCNGGENMVAMSCCEQQMLLMWLMSRMPRANIRRLAVGGTCNIMRACQSQRPRLISRISLEHNVKTSRAGGSTHNAGTDAVLPANARLCCC